VLILNQGHAVLVSDDGPTVGVRLLKGVEQVATLDVEGGQFASATIRCF
jgi:hypothetical protein